MENPSKFSSLYKTNYSKEFAQEERRKEILDKQKEQRSKTQDTGRGLEDFVQEVVRKDFHIKRNIAKYIREHKLQLSEWLIEKPEDLNRWILVPCPKGQRCLVIATEGRTLMYNKYGRFRFAFKSILPGSSTEKNHYTVLDCIYVEKNSTFYVLDVLAYNSTDTVFCEAEFRFFWIKSRLLENSKLAEISENNKYRFMPLEAFDFDDVEAISECLLKYPQFESKQLKLDGFLFYHKEASYVYGTTPLVGWLFAFMIPEVLHLDIHQDYMHEKPSDYVSYLDYMKKFDDDIAKKEKQRKRKEEYKNEAIESTEENMAVDIVLAEKEMEIYGERIDDPNVEEIE